MKTIKLLLTIVIASASLIVMGQNYKAPKIDASGKVTDEKGVFIGSVTKDGIITDAKGEKVAFINGSGMLVNSQGHVMGKPEKNGDFSPYFNGVPEKNAWIAGPPANGTCLVKNSKGEVVAEVHENYKMYGACAVHCLQNHMDHNKMLDQSKGSGSHATYACPMHPNQTSDKPGKCGECGMDMTK